MLKHKLVDFIIQFMEEVDKEISEMKLFVSRPIPVSSEAIRSNNVQLNARARFVAESFLTPVSLCNLISRRSAKDSLTQSLAVRLRCITGRALIGEVGNDQMHFSSALGDELTIFVMQLMARSSCSLCQRCFPLVFGLVKSRCPVTPV
jgi:ARP2/3 complex subunit ARPC4